MQTLRSSTVWRRISRCACQDTAEPEQQQAQRWCRGAASPRRRSDNLDGTRLPVLRTLRSKQALARTTSAANRHERRIQWPVGALPPQSAGAQRRSGQQRTHAGGFEVQWCGAAATAWQARAGAEGDDGPRCRGASGARTGPRGAPFHGGAPATLTPHHDDIHHQACTLLEAQ